MNQQDLENLYRVHSEGSSHAVFGEEDPFWNYYNQLEPRYRAQIDPYLRFDYRLGWNDRLRLAFGARSNYDSMREATAAQAWQKLGSLENDVFQNSFNSQQEQASRARDAGLNPDLSGEVQADPAAQEEQPTQVPQLDFLTPPSTLASDFVNLFDKATALVNSSSTFLGTLSNIGLQSEQTGLVRTQKKVEEAKIPGIQITNASNARTAVGDVLSSLHPDYWKGYRPGGEIDPAFADDLFGKYFENYPSETHPYIKAAIQSITGDPALMNKYYEAATKAARNQVGFLSASDYYGSPDFGTEIIREYSGQQIKWYTESLQLQQEYQVVQSKLDKIEAENAAELAEFARDNNLPEELGKAQLQQAIASKFQSLQDQRRIGAEREWLAHMQKLRRSDDPATSAAADYLIQAYFANQAPGMSSVSKDVRTLVGGVSYTDKLPLQFDKNDLPAND